MGDREFLERIIERCFSKGAEAAELERLQEIAQRVGIAEGSGDNWWEWGAHQRMLEEQNADLVVQLRDVRASFEWAMAENGRRLNQAHSLRFAVVDFAASHAWAAEDRSAVKELIGITVRAGAAL